LQYDLWAYVFMPDHVHLIVCPRQRIDDTSKFLQQVKEPVSRKAISYLKAHAPEWWPRIRVTRGDKVVHRFWQAGRGHDRNIENGCTLQQMIEYAHLNPVRAGFVERAIDWKWSSAAWFEGSASNSLIPDRIPADWLETDGHV